MRLVLLAQSRKRDAMPLVVGPSACQRSRGACVRAVSSVPCPVSQLSSSMATVTDCLALRKVPWVTSFIWFMRRGVNLSWARSNAVPRGAISVQGW